MEISVITFASFQRDVQAPARAPTRTQIASYADIESFSKEGPHLRRGEIQCDLLCISRLTTPGKADIKIYQMASLRKSEAHVKAFGVRQS